MGYFKRRLDRGRIRESIRRAEALADPYTDRAWLAIPKAPPPERCFLRFSSARRDEWSGRREGIFTAAYRLLRGLEAREGESAGVLREVLDRVGDMLPAPPEEFDEPDAIFLFRSDAGECVTRIWELLHRLAAHGIRCEMQVFTDPGRVVWEDEFQIAVIPSQRSEGL